MSKEENTHGLVPIGKIVRTHGVRGEVKVFPYGDTLPEIAIGGRILLGQVSRTAPPSLTLAGLRAQGKVWIARFEELAGIDAAQQVIGEELLIPEDQLPPTEEGEYYHYQLIGLDVVTVEGQRLGTLKGIIETGGNDVYSVESNGREILIPAIEDVIQEVDLERGRMIIDLPEGLVDDL